MKSDDAEKVEFTNSSAFKSGSYSANLKQLSLTFNSGKTYTYYDVPREYWAELCAADSQGLFFQKHIQNKFKYECNSSAVGTERTFSANVDSNGDDETVLANRLNDLLRKSTPRKVTSFSEILKAAQCGEALSQTSAGFAYSSGLGVPVNFAQAMYWFRRAALQGEPRAQFMLGLSYTSEITTMGATAYMWCKLAADQGFGIEKFAELQVRLTQDQITNGQALARAFIPKSEVDK